MNRQDIKFYNTAKGGVFDAQNRIKFEYTLRDHLYEAYFEDLDIWYELVKYHDWEIINYEANESLDTLEIFMKKFTKFIHKNKDRLNRIWYALFAEYDPTENVFEYENETNTKRGTVDHKGGIVVTYQNGKVTTYQNGKVTTYQNGKVLTKVKGQQADTYTDNSSTTTNYATAFDTVSELEKDKSVKSGGYTMSHGQGTDTETASGTDTETASGTDTQSISGSDVESKSGKDTDEYNTTDTRIFDKHGNIGVMKTQDMINAELKLRAHDLVSILVKDFVTETGYVHLSLEDLGYAD